MDQFSLRVQHKIYEWIDLCKPKGFHICDGSKDEYQFFIDQLVEKKMAKPLKRKGCYYFRSDPKDVARVEESTFICCNEEKDSGPTNNWCEPQLMKRRLNGLFSQCMEGRVMYIIPYRLGPKESDLSQVGIEVTDSLYVCVHMYKMTRMGPIPKSEDVVIGLHSVGVPLKGEREQSLWPCNSEKVIAHFPEIKEIYSFGSGYGGNALLAKKCHALRIASVIAREKGTFAEHMLVIGVTNPLGEKKYFAAAFPSACGKTNLAMMKPSLPGWKVECVGDDIAWMKFGEDGVLYAINPENGFFGVAPGTSEWTNPHAMKMMEEDTLFTNVALDGDDVWWEGMTQTVPEGLINWKGEKHDKGGKIPAAHPNSRFTASIERCPCLDSSVLKGKAVPIEGIIFGGRRAAIAPLVIGAKDWGMGTFYGANLTSEQTFAAEGTPGELRKDPFAMLPFCGYNINDYVAHFLSMEKKGRKMPKIFAVNWFRKNKRGKYVWPGFGENIRVIEWMFQVIDGKECGNESFYGYLPKSINTIGLSVDKEELKSILI